MASVFDVAKFFLSLVYDEEDEGISNMKLQKLVYYAQGFHLALFNGKPLFFEPIEAWAHGPVVSELYYAYKQFGANPITPEIFDPRKSFSKEQIDLLNEVYGVFGQFSAWKLRDMTHEEPTWLAHEAGVDEISHEEMFEYFKTRLD